MNKLNNKSGFTLIEIIVVLIIVGILAAIALPNLFSNIAKSKGGQALISLDNAKTMMESYYTLHSSANATSGAGDLTAAGAPTQAVISGTTFNLTISAAGANAAANATSGAVEQATGNIGANGTANAMQYTLVASDGTNSITLSRSTVGSWTCSAPTGAPYAGLC